MFDLLYVSIVTFSTCYPYAGYTAFSFGMCYHYAGHTFYYKQGHILGYTLTRFGDITKFEFYLKNQVYSFLDKVFFYITTLFMHYCNTHDTGSPFKWYWGKRVRIQQSYENYFLSSSEEFF